MDKQKRFFRREASGEASGLDKLLPVPNQHLHDANQQSQIQVQGPKGILGPCAMTRGLRKVNVMSIWDSLLLKRMVSLEGRRRQWTNGL